MQISAFQIQISTLNYLKPKRIARLESCFVNHIQYFVPGVLSALIDSDDYVTVDSSLSVGAIFTMHNEKAITKTSTERILLLHLVVLVKQFTLRGYTTTPLPRTGQSTKIVFLMQYAHSINTEFSHKFIILCLNQMSLTCQ